MKSKILAKYPKSKFETKTSNEFYVADFTKRTQKNETAQRRGVEFLDIKPVDPNDPSKPMQCLTVENPNGISIECNIFDDCQFVDISNNQLKHGECCFFPNNNNKDSWFSIAEIKDCRPSKTSAYKQDIQDKMDSMFQIFRNEVSITNRIYFVISFPRKKSAMNDAIYTDYVALKKYSSFVPLVSNRVVITNESTIDVKKTLLGT